MKKVVLVSLGIVFAAATVFAEGYYALFQNVSKYTVSAATPVRYVKSLSGPMTLRSNATSCSVFLNATTLARTVASTGLPLTANLNTQVNLPKTSHLTFTCATSAGDRSVYIAR